MKKVRIFLATIIIVSPLLLMTSGCEKFLDKKPLTATLDDLNQGGIEGQVFWII